MKKWLIWALIGIMLFGICGCINEIENETKSGEEKSFTVGFGKADVTPTAHVYLGSYNNALQRKSTEIKDNFYALSVVMTDAQDNTLVLIVTDLSWGYSMQAAQVKAALSKKYGIPGTNIMLGGTHNHNGPEWKGEGAETPENKAYLEYWLDGVIKSVDMAMEDRKTATMQIGTTETENMTFVRRYWREDGNLAGSGLQDAYVSSKSPIVSHESEGDEEVQMVRFLREDAKDILIGQWQCHGNLTGNTTVACTDWIGPMRQAVENELDCHFLYIQGAAGNMDPVSKIASEYPKRKTVEETGEDIAEVINAAYQKNETFTTVDTGTIKVKQEQFYDNEGTWHGELNAVAIGDLSLVTFPVEVFSETGLAIKNQTPFDMTLLMGYTNGLVGYVATREAHASGGYEVVYGRGNENTADLLVSKYLTSLKELYG